MKLWQRIVYGTGDWSLSSFNTFRQIFYAAFLTDVVGLEPRLASMAALVGVAWDAVNDPLVGVVSDRVRTGWGRRRPFLVLFAIPFGLAFVGLWWAPPWQSDWALLLHVALTYLITDTIQTFVSVPFYALTPELARDYDERTSLTAWRMFFNLAASLTVAVAGPVIVDTATASGATPTVAYLAAGGLFGFLGAIPPLLIAASLRERPDAVPEESPPLTEVLRGALRSRSFRWLTVLTLLNFTTFDMVGLMIPYYVTAWVAQGRDASYALLGVTLPLESAMLGSLIVVSVVFLPLWNLFAQRIGKRTAYLVAAVVWASAHVLMGLLPQGELGLAVALAAFTGIGVSAAHVLPDAMLPDVVDEDELATGRRNEGVYYGARNLFRKASGALAVFVALQTLGWCGYTRPEGEGWTPPCSPSASSPGLRGRSWSSAPASPPGATP
ncbi:MAG: MFS transporter [Myxococcales bacterium]|nr:MFS transporter [Myxococcales bacterium]